MSANTLFLRLEGPLQAWGVQESKFAVRRTAEAPTKSGIIGMLCAALGISRSDAAKDWLPKLSALQMGVRIDMPGIRWWDYHTVGADMQMRIAEGEDKTKSGAMLTRREYICDASFLVALQGEPELIEELITALQKPKWTLYLGRKSCSPSRPILEHQSSFFPDLLSALTSVPWQPRLAENKPPLNVDCLLDWTPPASQQSIAPDDAEVWYDVPITFEPPSHHPRFVIRTILTVGHDGVVNVADKSAQNPTVNPSRPRANYGNTEYRKARLRRLSADYGLCVFCKAPAETVQHITYERAGGNESQDDLRSLCRLCHDAVTMIEYGHGMGMERINPEELRWREKIIAKRQEIISFRSMETRRRNLQPKEVE